MQIVSILGIVLGVCLLVIASLLIAARPRQARPRSLNAAGGTFAVPPRKNRWLQMCLPAIWLLIYATFLIQFLTQRPVNDRGILRPLSLVTMTLAAAACVAVIVALAILWRRPPLAITKSGVRVGRRLVPWDGVAADKRLAARHLPITGPVRMPADANVDLGADPAFVGAAIGYYLRSPEAREAIGDPAELARLTDALAVA